MIGCPNEMFECLRHMTFSIVIAIQMICDLQPNFDTFNRTIADDSILYGFGFGFLFIIILHKTGTNMTQPKQAVNGSSEFLHIQIKLDRLKNNVEFINEKAIRKLLNERN